MASEKLDFTGKSSERIDIRGQIEYKLYNGVVYRSNVHSLNLLLSHSLIHFLNDGDVQGFLNGLLKILHRHLKEES